MYGNSYSRQGKNTGEVDFTQFLSGIPAKDYVFQNEAYEEQVRAVGRLLSEADAVVVRAGAGLSAAAGLTYGGKRFNECGSSVLESWIF